MAVTQTELGRRIKQAREQRGWTQIQLAEAIDLAQSAVSRIETGERTVDSLELAEIARALRVSVLELLEDRLLPSALGIAARLEPAEHHEAWAHTWARVQDLLALDRLLQEEGFQRSEAERIPVRDLLHGMAVDQGMSLAQVARAYLNLGDQPLPDLADLVERRFGIGVAMEPIPDGIAGICLVAEGTATMVIDSSGPLGRQRFTTAHELSHFLAGDADPLVVDEQLFGTGRVAEMRANAFAAHFLMPASGLRSRVGNRTVDDDVVAELMHAFQVSLEALLWQLQNLDLLSQHEHRILKAKGPAALSLAAGYVGEWAAAERQRDIVRPPAILVRRALDAYQAGVIGSRRIAALLLRDDVADLRRELEDAGISPDQDWLNDSEHV